jgi:hypothetical protein
VVIAPPASGREVAPNSVIGSIMSRNLLVQRQYTEAACQSAKQRLEERSRWRVSDVD